MFGLFKSPKLLVNTVEKVEIERELLGLIDFFGSDSLFLEGTIRPDELGIQLDGSPESLQAAVSFFCERLEIQPSGIRVVLTTEPVDSDSGMAIQSTSAAAEDPNKKTEAANFATELLVGSNLNLDSFLGELVRILMRQKIVDAGFIESTSPRLSYSAEVATAFFGAGLFTVNETVSCCTTTLGLSSYFSIRKLGSINSFGLGYLLALVSQCREERQIDIESYLRPDAALSFRRSQVFLKKTKDSLLEENNLSQNGTCSLSTIESRLQMGSNTMVLWTLGQIETRPDPVNDVRQIKSILFQLLKHSDIHVRQLALHLLSHVETFEADDVQQLQKIVRSRDEWTSAVAVNILSKHVSFPEIENDFYLLLQKTDHTAASNAAQVANRFGHLAREFSEPVCDRIRVALNRCDYGLGNWYVLILSSIHPEPQQQLTEYFAEDEELIRGAVELLQDAMQLTEIQLKEKSDPVTEITDVFTVPAWMNI